MPDKNGYVKWPHFISTIVGIIVIMISYSISRAEFTQFEKRFIDGTNIQLVGVNGIANTSDKMILAKRNNLWAAVDIDGEETDFDVFMDEFKEKVRVKSRFKMDTQINFPDEVVVNGF